MAEALRRSSRRITVKRDNDYVYDTEVLNALASDYNTSETRQQRKQTVALGTSVENIPNVSPSNVRCFNQRILTEFSVILLHVPLLLLWIPTTSHLMWNP